MIQQLGPLSRDKRVAAAASSVLAAVVSNRGKEGGNTDNVFHVV
jgi:hypothetical protein